MTKSMQPSDRRLGLPSPAETMIKRPTTHSALRFVLLIGTVSLFADFTYEGARSIAGPYLAYLGAGALVVSVIAGFGELSRYGLRLLSGRLADNPRNLAR